MNRIIFFINIAPILISLTAKPNLLLFITEHFYPLLNSLSSPSFRMSKALYMSNVISLYILPASSLLDAKTVCTIIPYMPAVIAYGMLTWQFCSRVIRVPSL